MKSCLEGAALCMINDLEKLPYFIAKSRAIPQSTALCLRAVFRSSMINPYLAVLIEDNAADRKELLDELALEQAQLLEGNHEH
mmetsp:Transcript_13577/g.25627  ORF Transcript_13577/g.25627 Transcript_13577/m.25627 type:complete len:83 (-) Transcript_13577:2332-2580(-)